MLRNALRNPGRRPNKKSSDTTKNRRADKHPLALSDRMGSREMVIRTYTIRPFPITKRARVGVV